MADFYNPYMKGPDIGQGMNQLVAQILMMQSLKDKGQGQPQTTQDVLGGPGSPGSAAGAISGFSMLPADRVGAATRGAFSVAPGSGDQASSLIEKMRSANLTPEEREMVLKVFKSYGGGTPGLPNFSMAGNYGQNPMDKLRGM